MFTPTFTITPVINTRIAEIEHMRAVVNHAVILPELEIKMRFRATVESTHSSVSIEGNPLSEGEVQRFLQGQTVSAPEYALTEVANYKKALDWLQKKVISPEDLQFKDILYLHGIVMKKLLPQKKVGAWRQGSIYVIDEIDGKEIIRYQGPAAERVPKLVKSFLKWLSIQITSKDFHPVLLVGLLHYIFVSIHPFSDGNGRTTRLLSLFYLKKLGYDFRGSLSLDSYYLHHKTAYYDALSLGETFDDRMHADMTPFLDFFTKGFFESAYTIKRHVLYGRITEKRQKTVKLDRDELLILDFVHQFGSVSIAEAMEIVQVSKRTTQRRLMNLVEKNVLKVEGLGPATRYVNA